MINKALKKPAKHRVMKKIIKRFMRYIRKPSNEFGFLVLSIFKKWFYLPTDIFIDDNGAWINLGDKQIILFDPVGSGGYSLGRAIPMTIEDEPQILVKKVRIELNLTDIEKIKDFVRTYKKEIIQLSHWKCDHKLDFFNLLEKDGLRKKKQYD
jgi:hypothetical protein